MTADKTFGDVPDSTVVIVPSGDTPTIKAMGNQAIRGYLGHAAETVPVVGLVCTGALVLAAAGLLEAAMPPPTAPTTACLSTWAPPTGRSGGWRTASSSPRPGIGRRLTNTSNADARERRGERPG
jgi:putative intracellular protease/amidase